MTQVERKGFQPSDRCTFPRRCEGCGSCREADEIASGLRASIQVRNTRKVEQALSKVSCDHDQVFEQRATAQEYLERQVTS